jgi:hypothetical protein
MHGITINNRGVNWDTVTNWELKQVPPSGMFYEEAEARGQSNSSPNSLFIILAMRT